MRKNNDNVNFKEWLVKLLIRFEERMKKIAKIKGKEMLKLSGESDIRELVSERFTEDLSFFDNVSKYCDAFSSDIPNIADSVTLEDPFDDPKNISNGSANFDKLVLGEAQIHPSLEKLSNAATLLDGRYQGKFVSPNVINLSKRHLSKDEISLLSKGLKFIPTRKHIRDEYQELKGNIKGHLEKIIKSVLRKVRNRKD